MWIELVIIGVVIYAIFGDYFEAKAALLREQAREKEIENNRRESE